MKIGMLEIFQRILKILENRGKSETEGGNASWSQGGWEPLGVPKLNFWTRDPIFISVARGSQIYM